MYKLKIIIEVMPLHAGVISYFSEIKMVDNGSWRCYFKQYSYEHYKTICWLVKKKFFWVLHLNERNGDPRDAKSVIHVTQSYHT